MRIIKILEWSRSVYVKIEEEEEEREREIKIMTVRLVFKVVHNVLIKSNQQTTTKRTIMYRLFYVEWAITFRKK